MFARVGLVAIALLAKANAHMQLYSPAPFMAYNNPHTPSGQEDDELMFPYDCCGETTPFPCRGYLSLLGTPAGAPTASWPAGSTQHMEMVGPAPLGGNHYGGSCQVSFSIDNGTTFRVAKSWEGDCPLRHNGELDPSKQDFPFTVPADLPTGNAVFAWTWINREQEFFMNCAAVTITGNGTSSGSSKPSTPSGSSKSSTTSATKYNSVTRKYGFPLQSSKTTTGSSSTKTGTTASTTASSSANLKAVIKASPSPSTPTTPTSAKAYSYAMDTVDNCICTCPGLKIADDGYATLSGCTCQCPDIPDLTKSTAVPKASATPDSGSDDGDDDGSDDDSAASSSSSSTRRHTHTRNRLFARATSAPKALEERAAAAAAFVPFSSRPLMFVGNINGCMTPKTDWELQYPNPGPDVQLGDGEYELKLPSGKC